MNVHQFINKWRSSSLTERAGAQSHFNDLCDLLGHRKPTDVDQTGTEFTFEKGAAKLDGGDGWADVWKRGSFAWEYKGKHKNLDDAYRQLQQYRDALQNPPLLVVSDMDHIVIRTNFTGTPVQKYEMTLLGLRSKENLDILRCVFYDVDRLKPGELREFVTTAVAGRIADIAHELRSPRLDPHRVARFMDRIIFCLFAEDAGLLREDMFTDILEKSSNDSGFFKKTVQPLFKVMARGGMFGADEIRHFNGNLFDDADVLPLKAEQINRMRRAAALDWSAVDPSIFGTLFERGLNPAKRSQIGAHYTSRKDIETLVEPVVMQPLRCDWAAIRSKADSLLGGADAKEQSTRDKTRRRVDRLLSQFVQRLASVTVLDPACGSGNFLYVTMQMLKDLENEVIEYAAEYGLGELSPAVGPHQLYGIEADAYAHELAQMSVWIGYLQWMNAHGYEIRDSPILRCMDNFQCMDAIIDLSDPNNPKEPEWPEVDFIVGNPPFLGGNRIRQELEDAYVDPLFALYDGRVPAFADLCCYWFEKARAQIAGGKCRRAGLLATQGIRGGANREVLKRIKETGDVFFAESDRAWVLDGANVHVSMVGFDTGDESKKTLDGAPVNTINANLSSVADITQARPLPRNMFVSFMGPSPKAPFDIDEETAIRFLREPINAHGHANSDVVRPVCSAVDLVGKARNAWTLDFGQMDLDAAAGYERPFEHIRHHVQPIRAANRRLAYAQKWWQYAEPRPGMRAALMDLPRYVTTPGVAKHRAFAWRGVETLCNQGTLVFARSDDYFFGVLHSRLHEVWALKLGTRLETRPRYTPTTCFETFPFPEPTPEQEAAISEAARELNELREKWLNPPEWTREEILEFSGSADGPWARYVHDSDERGIGTVRYPRIVAKDPDCSVLLAKRTLTNLYNERPTWLDLAHKKLDEAVFAAYGWEPSMTDDDILARLLDLNLARAEAEADRA